MTDMSTMQKIYFIGAWGVAGTALLALILLAVGWGRASGTLAFGSVCQTAFLGITGCFTLLYLSGWFTHSLVLFIMAWVVAGLAVLGLILTAAGPVRAEFSVGTAFWSIGFGTFCTLLMLHLSGKFSED